MSKSTKEINSTQRHTKAVVYSTKKVTRTSSSRKIIEKDHTLSTQTNTNSSLPSSNTEISSKHTIKQSKASRKAHRDSVRRLQPSLPHLQSDHVTVAHCVRTMMEKKTDAALIVNKNGVLKGIVTDRDIALKVVALGKNPKLTCVKEVMTPNVSCVPSNASALEALKRMVSGQFRHLPVTEHEKVVGILDIAKCLYQVIASIEKSSKGTPEQLNKAIAKLGKHFSKEEAANLFELLREKLFLPTLSAIVTEDTIVPSLGPSASAKDAAKLMLEKNISAVMVCKETDDSLMGICTSKDLLRRVVACELDPATALLNTIMTANPYTASLSTTILEALHCMRHGKFLHVPVFNEENKLVGLVDALQVTRGVMNQIRSHQFAQADVRVQPILEHIQESLLHDGGDSTEGEDADEEDGNYERYEDQQNSSTFVQSEVEKDRKRWDQIKSSLPSDDSSVHNNNLLPELQDLDTDPANEDSPTERRPDVFVYKLADCREINHRFTSSAESIKDLLRDVQTRLGDHTVRKIHYVDDDGDHILLFNDEDLKDAVQRARKWGSKYIRLIILHRSTSGIEPRGARRSSYHAQRTEHNDLGIVLCAAAAAAIAGASFLLSRRK